MTDNDIAALMTSLVEDLGAGDFERLLTKYSPDVVCHVGGENSISGTHRGVAAMVKMLSESAPVLGLVKVTPLWWRENRDLIFIEIEVSYEPTGAAPFTHSEALVYRIEKAEIAEVWSFDQNQDGVDQALAGTGAVAAP